MFLIKAKAFSIEISSKANAVQDNKKPGDALITFLNGGPCQQFVNFKIMSHSFDELQALRLNISRP